MGGMAAKGNESSVGSTVSGRETKVHPAVNVI